MKMRPFLLRLFPTGVAGAELVEFQGAAPLFPSEMSLVRGAVRKRREEFQAGRHCAREALAQLGHPPVPLLRDAQRAPIWPQGIVGSISHAGGFCGAVVARRGAIVALGFDVERRDAVTLDLWPRIASAEEHAEGEVQGSSDARSMVFSAKEAFYKAQYTLSRSWLEFEDVSIRIVDDGRFEVRLERTVPGVARRGALIPGQFRFSESLVFCAVALTEHDSSGSSPA